MTYGRKSFFCIIEEWFNKGAKKNFSSSQNHITNKLPLSEQKKSKEISSPELGKICCYIILNKTKQLFNDHQLMADLGIKENTESMKEIHVLIMFSFFHCIIHRHLENDIKFSIIDILIDSYIDLLLECGREEGIHEEKLFKELDHFKDFIIRRFTQYTKILKKYETNDVPGNEFEIGNDLIKVLSGVTSYKHNEKSPFPSMYFFSYFIELIMDEQINNTINLIR